MKKFTKYIPHLSIQVQYAVNSAVFLLIPTLLSAQIPQNIEVDGEAADGWQYLLWVLVLLFIVAAIFLILRMVNRRKEHDEENVD